MEKFSFFSGGHQDKMPQEISREQLVQKIAQEEMVQKLTELHRQSRMIGEEDVARHYKSKQPCFAVGVRFEGGKTRTHITTYTHRTLCDIDKLAPGEAQRLLEVVRKDPHTELAYITISGNGLRVIFPFVFEDGTDLNELHASDPERAKKWYTQAFRVGNEYYRRLLGLEKVDMQCKDCTRLSGLAHCPEVHYNAAAQPIAVPVPVAKTPAYYKQGQTAFRRAVEAVLYLLDQREVAYVPGNRNNYICQAGYLFNQFGIPLEQAMGWAETEFADYRDVPNAAEIFQSCYRRTEEFGTQPIPSKRTKKDEEEFLPQIETFIRQEVDIRLNVITGKREISWKKDGCYTEMNDHDQSTLWSRTCKAVKYVHPRVIHELLLGELTPHFNPFEEYFRQLPPWDGQTDYLAELTSHVHLVDESQRPLFEDCFRRWFVAIIPTLLEEQTINHEVLVLIGKQGGYKSTWLRSLLPPVLSRYFYSKTNSSRLSKDDLFSLTEFTLICLEEIECLSHSDMNQLKAMITTEYINERPVYGTNKVRRNRIASFCGTGNNTQFLNDPSGYRRWLPFEVDRIDNPAAHPINYEGLYSQAAAMWKEGFQYWFDQEEIERINRHDKQFEVPQLEEELILAYFRNPKEGEKGKHVSTAYIMEHISRNIKIPLHPVKVGLALKRLGFEGFRTNQMRGYIVIELTPEEIRKRKENGIV